jgi:hypothetical protein
MSGCGYGIFADIKMVWERFWNQNS